VRGDVHVHDARRFAKHVIVERRLLDASRLSARITGLTSSSMSTRSPIAIALPFDTSLKATQPAQGECRLQRDTADRH